MDGKEGFFFFKMRREQFGFRDVTVALVYAIDCTPFYMLYGYTVLLYVIYCYVYLL